MGVNTTTRMCSASWTLIFIGNNLTKSLNEDNRAGHSKTVIEENGTHHIGKKAANILADFYKEESEASLPTARRQEVLKIVCSPQSSNPNF